MWFSFTETQTLNPSLCNPPEVASVQLSLNWLRKSAVSYNTCLVYLTCVMTKTREEERTIEILCCQWVPMGYEFQAGQPQSQYDITLPSVLRGKWSAENWFCVSLYICLHINRHLPKAGRKVPLDYYETVARLSVVTKQHNTLFKS